MSSCTLLRMSRGRTLSGVHSERRSQRGVEPLNREKRDGERGASDMVGRKSEKTGLNKKGTCCDIHQKTTGVKRTQCLEKKSKGGSCLLNKRKKSSVVDPAWREGYD